MRNRIKTVRAHTSIFADGYGGNSDTFPGAGKTHAGLVMLRTPEGVEVTSDSKKSFLIPWGNIKSVDLYEDETPLPGNTGPQAV